MKKDSPIGIFDSGMGGLTVVKEVMRCLPHEDIVYFGDTARVPYGSKSRQTVIRFSIENILFLLQHDVKLIIVACNTSSSVALSVMREHFKVPVMGVIDPGAEAAVNVTTRKNVGVIGTRTTVKSNAYEQHIHAYDPKVKVTSVACPLFVPLAEEGWLDTDVTARIAELYLQPLKKARVDTLVLGCTHYPLLKKAIRKVMGDGVALVDSGQQVARTARALLAEHHGLRASTAPGKVRFFVSDEPENFSRQGKRFLGFSFSAERQSSYV